MRAPVSLIAVALALTVGCGDDRRASIVRDGGLARDAGAVLVDASEASDASSVSDASLLRDAGLTFDSGASPWDASVTDAGAAIDAGGAPDAGFTPIPSCYLSCTTETDCVINAGSLYDADNYTCTSGHCEWRGCNSTAECTESYGADYVCAQAPGTTFSSCHPACQTAADCAYPSSHLFGEDNYACVQNVCVWTGCNSATECTDELMSPGYTCAPQAGTSVSTCVRTCRSANDCVAPGSPLYGADNYTCTSGQCHWIGCTSTAECTQHLSDQRYVCE
ncbi:hypothetical protein L6R52_14960 [Myxococcota bacterium]|nr:hypothetical protein [Myxococcota bacterium]